MLFNILYQTFTDRILGDEVAERSKASVATHTVAGSNLGHGWHLFSSSHGVWRERPPSPPPRAWQKPTGAQ
ncbi:Uncharacterized protein FWK35_00028795 [Aphis craccivora]|uniref:Uncharacterized protein n=1 Tax=Aphis craccivora TaxID=307492 RepID=A0A6G0Y552_APHCR|nr:Uncharacterized protein FWK35_00028795 [Aphis craccivora]